MTEKFVQVLLPLALNQSYSYLSAFHDIAVGDIVLVEFCRKTLWGVVENISDSKPDNLELSKIKTIEAIHPRIKLKEDILKFINEISDYNLASKGLVLRSFINILNTDKVKKEVEDMQQLVDVDKFKLKELQPAQQQIFKEISDELNSNHTFVLDGVTGSGKTEIYFAVIAKILQEFYCQKNSQANHNNNCQILILLPEIALTSQLVSRFKEQFAFAPALWHSKISKKLKREIFFGIVSGNTKVIIGARSALLLPFKNLRLIVIDEEHDHSFKQEDVFNFHARDMAILKSKIENFPIILSSATPALETYNNAILGKYRHFIIDQKFGSQNQVNIIDLKQEKLEDNLIICNKLKLEVIKNFQENKQTLLFLNRRGYSPVAICKSCGKKYECSNCDFNLVYHKHKKQLVCHHCGHHEKVENNCKFCQSPNSLVSLGFGVEKLEEEVKNFLPEARILVITSDSVTNFSDAEKIVSKISNNEVDIIIGTQMIAKGYDFAKLNLVGIVDADAMLYNSDLRALERSFQTLTQVMGRAGRRQEQGKIFIQTYNPKNFLLENIDKAKNNFYDFELTNRNLLNLPPYSRMARFEISALNENDAKNYAKDFSKNFPFNEHLEIHGPAPASLQKLRNRHHFLLHLKAHKKINLQKLIANVFNSSKIPNKIRIRVNIDP